MLRVDCDSDIIIALFAVKCGGLPTAGTNPSPYPLPQGEGE